MILNLTTQIILKGEENMTYTNVWRCIFDQYTMVYLIYIKLDMTINFIYSSNQTSKTEQVTSG